MSGRLRLGLLGTFLWTLSACGGGAPLFDGGRSGTGAVAFVQGNVTLADGSSDVVGIGVAIKETEIGDLTNEQGEFEFESSISGSVQLRFERERDGLLAETDVVIPNGEVLRLQEVVLDGETGQATPTMQEVEFDGLVESTDCEQGLIFVSSQEDQAGIIFTVEVDSVSIEVDGRPLDCADLVIGDRIEIEAETADGVTLINARIELEDREDSEEEDDPDSEVEFEGFIDTIDCERGVLLMT